MTVYELVLRDFSAERLQLSVRCSKGFFVRTLAQDVGRALGCGAHLEALRRTASGPFSLAQALPLADLPDLLKEGTLAGRLMSMSQALVDLPEVRVSAADAKRVSHGVPVEVPAGKAGRVRVMGPDDALLAVAEVTGGRLRYLRVLV